MSENRIRKLRTGKVIPHAGPDSAGIFVSSTTNVASINPNGTVRDLVSVTRDATGTANLGATAVELDRAADVSANVITVTASTTLTEAAAEGRTIVMSSTTGLTVTLPSVTAGAGGGKYRIQVGRTQTAGPYIVKTASSVQFLAGSIIFTSGSTTAVVGYHTTASTSTLSLNGGTTGGAAVGDFIEVQNTSANTYAISNARAAYTGTNATPFTIG